jgi:hypothetical protein
MMMHAQWVITQRGRAGQQDSAQLNHTPNATAKNCVANGFEPPRLTQRGLEERKRAGRRLMVFE